MNMFTVITSCFDAVPACDGRTDGQTDVQTDGFDSRFAVCIVSVTKMEELTKNVVYGQPATPILNGPNRIWFINVVTCRCRSISDEYIVAYRRVTCVLCVSSDCSSDMRTAIQ